MVRYVVSPFDLSLTLPVGGGLLVPCSFLGPPGINNSCKWLLWCLAGVGGSSQCASPNSSVRVSLAKSMCFIATLSQFVTNFSHLKILFSLLTFLLNKILVFYYRKALILISLVGLKSLVKAKTLKEL